jgi:hypothetical protein
MTRGPTPFKIFIGVAVGIALLVLVLTQTLGGPSSPETVPELEPNPVPSAAPSATSPQPPVEETGNSGPAPSGTILYEHDFSSPENGLLAGQSSDTASNEFGSRLAEYTSRGTLLVRSTSDLPTYVAGANTEGMVVDGRDLAALRGVSIEADATPVDLGVVASWGLACRRDREVGRFYYAYVSLGGGHASAGIIRQDQPGGDWTEVAPLESLPAQVTIGEGETNRMRLACIGSTLTLYVDGQQVAEGNDARYGSGSIALFVSPLAAGQEASAEAEFDNLVIREA